MHRTSPQSTARDRAQEQVLARALWVQKKKSSTIFFRTTFPDGNRHLVCLRNGVCRRAPYGLQKIKKREKKTSLFDIGHFDFVWARFDGRLILIISQMASLGQAGKGGVTSWRVFLPFQEGLNELVAVQFDICF